MRCLLVLCPTFFVEAGAAPSAQADDPFDIAHPVAHEMSGIRSRNDWKRRWARLSWTWLAIGRVARSGQIDPVPVAACRWCRVCPPLQKSMDIAA